MRNLATIQRIKSLNPIPDADAIELAEVLGWKVVVGKVNNYSVGQLVVYVEVDSLLPVKDQFDWLAKNGTKKSVVDDVEYEGYRIRTIKLRGQVSQGLCIPIEECPELDGFNIVEGADVTEMLGIVKYEPPIPASLAGKVKGPFPGWLTKTDETRIQAFPEVLTRYIKPFYATEKLDGSSFTAFCDENGELNVCSRNLNLVDDDNTLWKVAKKLGLAEKLADGRFALQGELVGPGIQGNKLKLAAPTVYFFNVFSIPEGIYLDYYDMVRVINSMDLKMVPVLNEAFYLLPTVDEMVQYATRRSALCPEVLAEGVVFRPLVESRDSDLGRLSFKVINPSFLLKYED